MTPARMQNAVTTRSPSVFSSWRLFGWLMCIVLLAADQWLLAPALFTLLVGWHVLSKTTGPLAMPAAFAYQWVQVTIALFYLAITGRQIADMKDLDFEPMVIISLLAITVFFGGYRFASRAGTGRSGIRNLDERGDASTKAVFAAYSIAIALSILINRNAWSFPAVTQILYVTGFARFGLLYVLITRLANPRPQWLLISAIVIFEVAIGFTGYFASFREPLVFIGLALTASLSTRRPTTWLALGLGAAIAVTTAVTWTAVKPVVRAKFAYNESTTGRLKRVVSLIGPAMNDPATGVGAQVDKVVSRLWMMRFPSLAFARVPAEAPHEGGKLIKGAITNAIMPRAIFTEKGVLPSESEKVRKYSGVYVAGRERGTSFAFGYVAESYVDYGRVTMFVPILLFGMLLGLADRVMRRVLKDPDVLNAVRVVVLWSSAYAFEQSWSIMIGTALSLFIVMTAIGMGFDHLITRGAIRSVRVPDIPAPRPVRLSAVQSRSPEGGSRPA